ncbi:hypothetical protein [Marinicrinis lubricantis]|uniref:Uncharacterized protein n=1 Tax=Marinicrinis lubricantis TaxID=2086470 RepID=A0ABW1IUQ6_9BACL
MSRLREIVDNHHQLDDLSAIIRHYGLSAEFVATALLEQCQQQLGGSGSDGKGNGDKDQSKQQDDQSQDQNQDQELSEEDKQAMEEFIEDLQQFIATL